MSKEKIYIFDTTLRDGAQTEGVDFSIEDNGSSASLGITATNHFGNFEKRNGRASSDTSQQRHFASDKGMEFTALTVRDIKWGRD